LTKNILYVTIKKIVHGEKMSDAVWYFTGGFAIGWTLCNWLRNYLVKKGKHLAEY